MKVSEVMTRHVACCSMNESLAAAASVMWDVDCGCVPIVDDARRVVGIITDRDIAMAALSQGKPLEEMRIASAASTSPCCVDEGDPIEKAEALMQRHQIRRLPVVTDGGTLAGIVSMNDLARRVDRTASPTSGLSGAAIVQTLAAVSAPRVARA